MLLVERETLFSPAKINLGLAVIGRRDDGYHLIQSVFWPLDFGDTIEVETAASVGVTMRSEIVDNVDAVAERDNLVFRALEAIRDACGATWRARIEKRIPLGGGLGGGSSNAGTVLRFAERRGLIDRARADAIALRLGADVPFFLAPKPAWVEGIGERIAPLFAPDARPPALFFLLVMPPGPCPTAAVFRTSQFAYRPLVESAARPAFRSPDAFVSALAGLRNDLAPAAVRLNPDVGDILGALEGQRPSAAMMSGSGSTCVAVFYDERARQDAAKELSPLFRKKHCRYILAQSLGENDAIDS